MLCKHPYNVRGQVYVSCGTCLFCRINKAREWQHRILLEMSTWEYSSFVTLTYDNDNLPEDYSVDPKVLQKFLKRVRRRVEPWRIRFYGVGEYGDPNLDPLGLGRPHYHVALFGVRPVVGWCNSSKGHRCFSENNVVEDSWKHGFVHVGEINKHSARYMTNYVTKFMNFKKSEKLQGRTPEFSRMSTRPGIGAPALVSIAERLLEKGYPKERIISELHYGNHKLPLGNYLKENLHKMREGDILAEFREGRSRLFDLGIEYIGWVDYRRNKEPLADSYDDCVGLRPVDVKRRGFRDFLLAKTKGRRFATEANRRQFRQRRCV
jgi:hypothetical protein